MSFTDSEPALTTGAVTAIVVAIMAVFVAFGGQLSREQQAAILGLVGAIAPIVAAFVIRQHVWPAAKVDNVPIAKAALLDAEGKP